MQRIVKSCFSKANMVTDRFHVQKLTSDAVQEIRISYRWEAIEQEKNEIELAKETNNTYKAEKLENGDTLRQLLARNRYLLFKSQEKWTTQQVHRAELLFGRYPKLEQAYLLSSKHLSNDER